MKKIIHKLKKNRLVSKIAALLTICMILVSSFTVSSFASDEEEATNSITNVWTGVIDSIMSLLGTAQGVFIESVGSSNSIVLNSADIFEIYTDKVYYLIELPGFDPSSAVLDDSYEFTVFDEVYTLTLLSIAELNIFSSPTSPFSLLSYTSLPPEYPLPLEFGAWYLQMNEPFSGSTTLTSPFTFSGGFELTFLGTLAAIGVAIALIMLFVYVISRFLRLRG